MIYVQTIYRYDAQGSLVAVYFPIDEEYQRALEDIAQDKAPPNGGYYKIKIRLLPEYILGEL